MPPLLLKELIFIFLFVVTAAGVVPCGIRKKELIIIFLFDEIPSMTLKDIKETKRYGHTFFRSDGRTDNVKTVYPPTNTVCGGIINENKSAVYFHKIETFYFAYDSRAKCCNNG